MTMPEVGTQGAERTGGSAFTLLELSVTVAMLALLCALTVPCLTRTNPASKMAQCQANVRRLLLAWRMYADDSSGKLAPVYHGIRGAVILPPPLGPGWCQGWLDWTTSSDNTNVELLVNPKYARFGPYLGQQPETFKCPADQYLSQAQRAAGWKQRVRSYCLAAGIGAGDNAQGPWNLAYRQITNITDFLYPSPAETWVFSEPHPDSANSPAFFSPAPGQFIDIPALYHNGACSFSFADGHTEMHRWVGALSKPAWVRTVSMQDGRYINVSVSASPGDVDLHWLSYHTQRQSTNSY